MSGVADNARVSMLANQLHSASGFCQIPSLSLRHCAQRRTVLADESIGCETLDVWHVGCTIRTVTNEAGAKESLKS